MKSIALFLLSTAAIGMKSSGIVLAALIPTQSVDAKRYSYFCLESDQTLCLGISPGDGDPVWDPNGLFYLQVKSRTRTEYTNTDYKKTRWDADYAASKISLSRFSELCAAKEPGMGRIALYPCNTTLRYDDYDPNAPYGLWDLSLFSLNSNGAGTLELLGSRDSMCLSVMKCNTKIARDGTKYCDVDSTDVAWDVNRNVPDGLTRGAYVRMRPCYDAPGGNPLWTNVQIWRQRLDCAVGCPPFLQLNGVCDQACYREECDYDNGACETRSPTPPTRRPTVAATNIPTRLPTSQRPSRTPTVPQPTVSPTRTPSSSPTLSPSVQPSYTPSVTPSMAPTTACPPPGELEFCAAMSQRKCTKNALAKQTCVWCQDQCSPRRDPRVCFVPDFYKKCKAVCPTDDQRRTCSKATSRGSCTNSKWKRSNCLWCNSQKTCYPGRDFRVCSDTTLFDHCGTIAPTGPPCPGLAAINMCLNSASQETCPVGRCTWCGGSSHPCRPSRTSDVCSIEFSTTDDLISKFFTHCPKLYITSRPSRAPTVPTFRPSASPHTSFPSRAPVTSKPTKSPSVSRPTSAPTMLISPTTLAPSWSPTTSAPSRAPITSTPSFTPSRTPSRSPSISSPTKSPTKRPTTLSPTNRPTSQTPSRNPTMLPTKRPSTKGPTRPTTFAPSRLTGSPSTSPVLSPSASPRSSRPSASPSRSPASSAPTNSPSYHPTLQPTSQVPSRSPTSKPTSKSPTRSPSLTPTRLPSNTPTRGPSASPTIKPSFRPSASPTIRPTSLRPTSTPSTAPSDSPTTSPNQIGTASPTSAADSE